MKKNFTCVVCDTPVDPEKCCVFEFNEELYYFCDNHAEPFKIGMSLGQIEINHKFVSFLSNLPEPITKTDLKKSLLNFSPMSKFTTQEFEKEATYDLANAIKTPQEFFDKLTETVIGQDTAKKAISVAVINHLGSVSDGDPITHSDRHHVLMLGKSGSGKTLIAKTAANILNLPFVMGDATNFSPTGFHGADVDSVCYDLLLDTDMNFDLAERGVVFIDEIDKICSTNKNAGKYESFIGSTQSTFLKLVEGKIIKIPGTVYGDLPGTSANLSSEKMLFFFGGAFNGLADILAKIMGKQDRKVGFRLDDNSKSEQIDEAMKSYEIFIQASREQLVEALIEFGMLSELVGRIPTIVPLKPLDKNDLKNVLFNSVTSPITKQIKTFEKSGYQLEFTEQFINEVVDLSYKSATGTRALDSYIKKAVSIASFDLLTLNKPKVTKNSIIIDKNCIINPALYQKSSLMHGNSITTSMQV
jgi:ATP-dependent Clp protease ATP-binding subunit ClpX